MSASSQPHPVPGNPTPPLPVAVIGTGLTMVDAVMTLRRRGFEGRIVALFRRGLVPAVHAPSAAPPPPVLSAKERASLSVLWFGSAGRSKRPARPAPIGAG